MIVTDYFLVVEIRKRIERGFTRIERIFTDYFSGKEIKAAH
jgi:hypothetical protein